MELKDLFTALAKAQAEYEFAHLDKDNPFLKSKYATFQSIVQASRAPLIKYGLTVTQVLQTKEDGQYLVTILGHSSGQYIESTCKLAPIKPDVQALGAYITYMRRYSYAAITGVITGDDEDGERNTTVIPPHYNKISADQMEILATELEGHPDIALSIKRKLNIENLSDMLKPDFMNTLNRLREIKNNKKN